MIIQSPPGLWIYPENIVEQFEIVWELSRILQNTSNIVDIVHIVFKKKKKTKDILIMIKSTREG